MNGKVAGTRQDGNRLAGGAVDETGNEAYYLMVMKPLIYKLLALVLVLAGAGIPVAAEDLDAALAAQKKKAQRRVYSDSALVEDHNLSVPKTETEEDRQLDKKLKEMEDKANVAVSLPNPDSPHRTAPAPVRSVKDKNWLATAVMGDSTSFVSQAESTDDDWIAREAARQKTKDDTAKEDALVQKLLHEKTQSRPQNTTPELERLKQYQLDPKKFNAGKEPTPAGPSYMLPQSGTPDPMAAIRPTPKKENPPPLFSPQAAKAPLPAAQTPLNPLRNPLNSPMVGSPSRSVSPGVSSRPIESEMPLTPLQMIKKSSPINRQDPFAIDPMPKLKTSIWD
ncbi:MAG: hypothetical protein HOO88_00390 [Kiritimatiellaceae bacterium]|nr:hypothetical protein [Kiritimatiellaceae bacterium]